MVEFVDQQIGPYGTIPTDDVSLLRHLDFITRSSVKMAHIGAALYRTAQDLPLHATKAFMEEAKREFDRIKGMKEELEVNVAKLEKDLANEKASSLSLVASVSGARNCEQYFFTTLIIPSHEPQKLGSSIPWHYTTSHN